MLRNPTSKATVTTEEIVENEYEKLKFAWEHQIHAAEKQKQEANNNENIQFTLMHLFHGYLNQIWIDSQNMLQCAQSWNSDENQKDAAFTMNILGLHLMKQSLRTRQELFHIVDEASSGFDYFSMPPTTEKSLYSAFTSSLSSSSCSIASNQRPIKLSSSPSTPTINNSTPNHWQDTTATCKHTFTPGSNYSLYFPESNDKCNSQNLSCHICHEKLGLKKSFSADNFCTLTSQISSSVSSNSDYETEEGDIAIMNQFCGTSNNNSTFEIEYIENDMLASRKLLVEDDQDDGNSNYKDKLIKYQLIDKLHESSKVEVDDDNTSISSSGTTMEELKMKRSTINNSLLHERIDSSSTCLPQSIYSSDNCDCENTSAMPRKKRNLSMFFNVSKVTTTSKTSFKDKLKQYRKDSADKKGSADKNTIPRSLSSTICHLFSTSNKGNKQQQVQI